MLMSLTIIDAFNDPSLETPCLVIMLIGNSYFNIFEILQFLINGRFYFFSIVNIMDISRIILIYLYGFGAFDSYEIQRSIVLPVILLLMWCKVIIYLAVFKPTRYLIKMI